jgi:hypothetical protein
VNREQWLNELMFKLAPALDEQLKGATATMDTWRVSVGWPGGGNKRTRIGECWGHTASKDGRTEMFISPILDDPYKVAEVLLHEMCHAVMGMEEGHGKSFARLARGVGLTGPVRSTVAGPELIAKIGAMLREMPDYPHAAMAPGEGGMKKQSTRLIKANCRDCGYTIRLTAKWISVGLPTCPCGCRMVAG